MSIMSLSHLMSAMSEMFDLPLLITICYIEKPPALPNYDT